MAARKGGIQVDGHAHRAQAGCTPLALAARNGHADVVARLLAHGANPSLRDLEQVAPLWYAARDGHASVVRLLLASGRLTDVNPRPVNLYEHETETPLAIALKEGHRETAGLLASADGIDLCVERDPDDPQTGIVSYLGLAVLDGYEDVALTLLDKCELGRGSGDKASRDVVESASKLLVFAAGSGCSNIVRELLAKHSPDVNTVHYYMERMDGFVNPVHTSTRMMTGFVRQSALMAASRNGHASVVRLLLDTEGIRPDLSAGDGVTALILAAAGGFVDVVKMLLADGRVEADYKDLDGRTALSHAAEHAHEAVVAELLAIGAVNPDSQDGKARTPLIWAVDPYTVVPVDRYGRCGWQRYEGVVRRLLANSRVNPNSIDSLGSAALSYAARNGGLGLVTAILEHPETDLESGPEHRPLVVAAGAGHADVVQVLLNTGRVDVHGGAALIAASKSEHENVVQLLLSAPGIDPNVKDESGNTPLMTAARNGVVEVVKLLVAAGVDPNIQDGQGRTALCHAAISPGYPFLDDSVEVMRVLVGTPGINADLADNMGRTALSLAAEAGNVERVKILLAVDGINPDARDTAGRNPLSWVFAEDWDNDQMTDERKEMVRHLLRIPAVDPNAEDAEGLTPLLRAIQFYNSNEFVELLVSRPGLDVNQQGRDGVSPLALAKSLGNTLAMALLRAHGATTPDDSAQPDEDLMDEPTAGGCHREQQQQQPQQPSSHRRLSSSARSESSVDKHMRISKELKILRRLRHDLTREYRLPLSEQQAYVGEWAAESTAVVVARVDVDVHAGQQFHDRVDIAGIGGARERGPAFIASRVADAVGGL